MNCSMSQDMNLKLVPLPLDGSFEMEEGGHMEGCGDSSALTVAPSPDLP